MHSVGKRGSLGVYPGPEIGETKKKVAHRAPLFNWETSWRMQWEPSTEPFGTPKRMPKTDLPQRTTESPTSNSAPEPSLWLKIPKLMLLGKNGSYFCVSTPSLQPAFRISLHRMAQRGSFQALAALADLKCPETKTKIWNPSNVVGGWFGLFSGLNLLLVSESVFFRTPTSSGKYENDLPYEEPWNKPQKLHGIGVAFVCHWNIDGFWFYFSPSTFSYRGSYFKFCVIDTFKCGKAGPSCQWTP